MELPSVEEIREGALFEALEGRQAYPVTFRQQLVPIYDLVRSEGWCRTLETGLGIGGSACHILAAGSERHVAMDPVQGAAFGNQGLRNVERFGLSPRLDFRPAPSWHALPELARGRARFDFIYVDGDHRFESVLTDFYYGDVLLDAGGCILFDDAWMPSVRSALDFVRARHAGSYRLEPFPNPLCRLLRKIAKTRRGKPHAAFRGLP